MYRDGVLKSIWQSEIKTQKTDNPLSTIYDVIIVGAGITGLSSAVELQSRGKNCLILEAENTGFGTTGGSTAHLNTFFDASYDQVINDFGFENAKLFSNSGKEAIENIRYNIHKYEISCGFEDKTAYLFALDSEQKEKLKSIMEASNKVGIEMKPTEISPFPIPFVEAVEIQGQAQIHPIQYINGLKRAFLAMGGNYLEKCRVTDHINKVNNLGVITTMGEFESKYLIYATHTPIGVNLLHFRNRPFRSYAIGVELKNSEYPQALGYDLSEPYNYYRSQIVDGKQYLIVGGKDHQTGEIPEDGDSLSGLENDLRTYYDVENVVFRWSSQFFESADGLPYIGKIPGGPDEVFVATGYNGNGITLGSLAGKILSDMIVEGHSKYGELFNPRRVKPMAGFSKFTSHNLNVATHWIGDKISKKHISELDSLENDEGRVVRYEGKTLAIYKDPSGEVHALRSLCTHVQCTVQWNPNELTWDCPCHGSRFGVKGNVLNSPAVQPLDPIDLIDDQPMERNETS